MNYLFRPTPVVVLGRDMGADVVQLSKTPAGMMAGAPPASGRPSRSLATQGSPWIVRSGTMAIFGTLGQDASSDIGVLSDPGSFDPGTIDGSFDGSSGIDFSSFPAPNLPAAVPPDFPAAPDIGSPSFAAPSFTPTTVAAPISPSSIGAGPTGQSIPGTQPVNPIQAGTSALNAITNLFKPSAPKPPKAITLPAVGVNPKQDATSFWTGSTVVPGVPNTTVLLGGAAAVILLMALMGSKGK